ncbi:MAG: sulfotransferase domain-containing protein [Dongiaceae bacterium]
MRRPLRHIYRLLTSKWERKVHRLNRERRKLIAEADFIIVSFPKSGKTWLRALLTRLYQRRHGLPEGVLVDHDNLHRLDDAIPKILFTHACDPLGAVEDLRDDKADYAGRKVVFLMRHPCDVVVSHYYQLKHRKAGKRENATRGMELFEFVTEKGRGIEYIIAYVNGWWRYVGATPNTHVVRYEELKRSPEATLKRLLDFFGDSFAEAEISEAVQFCKFENLQQRERDRYYSDKALRPADPDDKNSFKVRRGKSGGYKEDLQPDQVAVLEGIMEARLDPSIGY